MSLRLVLFLGLLSHTIGLGFFYTIVVGFGRLEFYLPAARPPLATARPMWEATTPPTTPPTPLCQKRRRWVRKGHNNLKQQSTCEGKGMRNVRHFHNVSLFRHATWNPLQGSGKKIVL